MKNFSEEELQKCRSIYHDAIRLHEEGYEDIGIEVIAITIREVQNEMYNIFAGLTDSYDMHRVRLQDRIQELEEEVKILKEKLYLAEIYAIYFSRIYGIIH